MIDWEFHFHCIFSEPLRGCFWLLGVLCPEDWPDRSLLVRKHKFLGSDLSVSFLNLLILTLYASGEGNSGKGCPTITK